MTPKTLSPEKGNTVNTTKTKLVLGHAGKSHPIEVPHHSGWTLQPIKG